MTNMGIHPVHGQLCVYGAVCGCTQGGCDVYPAAEAYVYVPSVASCKQMLEPRTLSAQLN